MRDLRRPIRSLRGPGKGYVLGAAAEGPGPPLRGRSAQDQLGDPEHVPATPSRCWLLRVTDRSPNVLVSTQPDRGISMLGLVGGATAPPGAHRPTNGPAIGPRIEPARLSRFGPGHGPLVRPVPGRSGHGPCQRRCRTGALGIEVTPAGRQALFLAATWEHPRGRYVEGRGRPRPSAPRGRGRSSVCRSHRL